MKKEVLNDPDCVFRDDSDEQWICRVDDVPVNVRECNSCRFEKERHQ